MTTVFHQSYREGLIRWIQHYENAFTDRTPFVGKKDLET
jgi:hypothetical protein